MRPVRSGVTATTICTLPSFAAASTTTPLVMRALSESARPRSASLSRSATFRRASVTPLTCTVSSVVAPAPPPIAILVLSCVTSRAQTLAFRLQLLDRVDGLILRHAQRCDGFGKRGSQPCALLDCTSTRQRLDSANASRDAAFRRIDEEADVAGGRDMCAAAQFHAEPGDTRRRGPCLRISRRTAPLRLTRWLLSVDRTSVVTGALR